jgi:hypothetical protein
MKPHISVWHDPRLPQHVIEVAKTLTCPQDLRHNYGVDSRSKIVDGEYISFLIADGHCGAHEDYEEVSLLWVARNDTNSWVGSTGVPDIQRQPIGTVILLNIEKEHYLEQENGVDGIEGVWAAVLIEEFHKWPAKKDVTKSINDFLKEHHVSNK